MFLQTLAERSKEKSEKLKFVEISKSLLQEKDRRLEKEIDKSIELHKELDKLKLERTRETWLLKQEIANLEKEKAELDLQGA